MIVCHVITDLETGGAETALCRLLESLKSEPFTHHVVALGGEAPLSARARAAGAQVTHLNITPRHPEPWRLTPLRRLLTEQRPNLVHAWMYHANLASAFVVVGIKAALIWSIRQSLYDLRAEKRLTRLVIKSGALLSLRPQVIVYNSVRSAGQHEAIGYKAEKSRIIPNGFDTQEFRPDPSRRAQIRAELDIPDDAFVVGLVARFHPMKGHDHFLRAAARFASRSPCAVFVLVGDGVTRQNLALWNQINDLGLNARVRLCGRRHDIAGVNAALDVASSSSLWGEAFPNSVGEAMACAIPCVATDIGDVRSIVNRSGFIVPPGDPEALCMSWSQLEEMGSAGRRSLGAEARERIEKHYALAAVTREYANLYRQMERR